MALDLDALPEVFLSTERISSAVSRAARRGRLRKIGPRLYTRNLDEPVEQVVRRNLWQIAGLLFPGAVISHRTALEYAPSSDGSVFLTASTRRDVDLPGARLRARRGPGPLEGDRPFIGGLHLASPARGYLENMTPSRARKGVARTLAQPEVERRLEAEIRARGDGYANELRDEARRIAPALGLEREARQLEALIGALLGSRKAVLLTDVGAARAAGTPFDPARMDLLAALHAELLRTAPPVLLDPHRPGEGTILPFFEAYFSNFIEGTEFEVDEAREIVFEGKIPEARPEDAHDVLGTYRLVSDRAEMSRVPESESELLSTLRERHAEIMSARPDRRPGAFRLRPNQAGATAFVAPDLVEGTLRRGFELLRALPDSFQRAVFVMFLVTEVHPFDDGNGRVARVMMNAELVAEDRRRVLVPTVFRNDYVSALKALSHNRAPEALIRCVAFAQRYTQAVDFGEWDRTLAQLRATNAFVDPVEADAAGIRLVLPRGAPPPGG